ncbi:phenylacetaldehyde reductase-like [Aristolochia californica]|uniref:phenylacetaldehyde reductase-like n=1 Tax=Aristolochia californica TaxID=171875 RepID=UPI0035DDA03E
MGEVGKVVCVTGASGYIASWLVKLLLKRGYTVKATVRDLNDPKKTEHLLALEGAKERLHLVQANLLQEGSFDAAVDGCEGVFHTASPVYFRVTDPQVELLDPAVKGTLNILGSCARTSSIKKVVMTSSFAAVGYTGRPMTPEMVVDESWFSDPEFCKSIKAWYLLSKTLAEAAAWEFAKDKGINLVTINPSVVIGPLLQPSLNASAETILNLINGSPSFRNSSFGWVDVRDVANAHILAYEDSSASGRYLTVGEVVHLSGIAKILRELYPNLPIPDKCADDNPYVPTYQVSKERAKSLGLEFTSLELSVKNTVDSLREKNFVNF